MCASLGGRSIPLGPRLYASYKLQLLLGSAGGDTRADIDEHRMLIAGTRLGPYEIHSVLGSGGMGEVYRARDTRLERDVAIKVLPPHLTHDADARSRLRREALAAAGLDHPFICKIFEIGDHEDTLFIVMEFVVGETLHARLAAGPPQASEALRIAGEIAEAIEAAHARRIVHRDLKPANVMLTTQGRVKVMDFGLAKQLPPGDGLDGGRVRASEAATNQQSSMTASGTRVGTPDYMSPEQVLGDRVDERSDLFSFGIVLCELMTGRHPFRRSSSGETMAAILRDPPSIGESSAANVTSSLSVFVRLLAKEPAGRYGTMSEARRALSRLTGGSAPAPSPPASAYEASRAPERTMVGRDAEHAELVRGLEE